MKGGGYREPQPPDLTVAFKGQDNTPPKIFDPIPKTYKELLLRDPVTARVLKTASTLLSFLNQQHQRRVTAFLVGGLGAAALVAAQEDNTHTLYRSHDDIDILIPKTLLEACEYFFSWTGGLKPIATGIYRTEIIPGYFNIPRVPIGHGPIQVDLFTYESDENKGVFPGLADPLFSFKIWETQGNLASFNSKECDIYGLFFPINEDAVLAMKKLDMQRDKGLLDYSQLKPGEIL